MEFPIKSTSIYKIEWLNACEYNLTISVPKTWADSVFVKMHVKGQKHRITTVTGDYVLEKVSGSTDTLWFRK